MKRVRLSLLSKRARYKAFWAGQERRASSASVVAVSTQGEVLVVKASYKKYWSFPGGVVDAGETPRTAALRELTEETGLSLLPSDLSFSMVLDRQSVVADTYQFVFECTVDHELFSEIRIDNDEIVEWALVTREAILAGDRQYSTTVTHWAAGNNPYMEVRITENA